jgi:hypothetical protein
VTVPVEDLNARGSTSRVSHEPIMTFSKNFFKKKNSGSLFFFLCASRGHLTGLEQEFDLFFFAVNGSQYFRLDQITT